MHPYLSVHLMGGLGNQLFQLAALHSVARKSGRIPILVDNYYKSPHANHSYFESILQQWKAKHKSVGVRYVEEPSFLIHDWTTALNTPEAICMMGYFQDFRYIDPEFIQTLTFSDECLARHPDISNMVFLHIRGGDYIGNSIHEIDLDAYYRRAIAMFPGARFAIFTNDMAFANKRHWLEGLNHTFITENEIDSLLLMSKCVGGICANSTFSWWGAYLNRNRKLVLPDVWDPTYSFRTEGLYFPETIKCSVIALDTAHCIHLAHRKDRRAHMDDLAAKYPSLQIQFVDGILNTNGGIGCNLSHKKVIREAKLRGDPYVLVLEDDCEMLVSDTELVAHLNTIHEYIRLHPEVEIVNGCGNLPELTLTSSISFKDMHFLTSNVVYTTHFIIYYASSYDKLLESSAEVPPDIVTNECKMVFTYPYLATQLPSYSDIQKADVSYENIEKSRAFVQNSIPARINLL
jgi:hypothetical protein